MKKISGNNWKNISLFMDWKAQHSQDVNSPQIDIQL